MQVSVDLFVLSRAHVDLATLACISRMTTGQVYHYHPFHAPIHAPQLLNDLRWNITRPQVAAALPPPPSSHSYMHARPTIPPWSLSHPSTLLYNLCWTVTLSGADTTARCMCKLQPRIRNRCERLRHQAFVMILSACWQRLPFLNAGLDQTNPPESISDLCLPSIAFSAGRETYWA